MWLACTTSLSVFEGRSQRLGHKTVATSLLSADNLGYQFKLMYLDHTQKVSQGTREVWVVTCCADEYIGR